MQEGFPERCWCVLVREPTYAAVAAVADAAAATKLEVRHSPAAMAAAAAAEAAVAVSDARATAFRALHVPACQAHAVTGERLSSLWWSVLQEGFGELGKAA